MTRHIRILLLALASVPALARAESVSFKFVRALYQDAKEGALRAPEGVACNDGGAVVVADTGNSRLLTYSLKDDVVSPGAEIKLPQLVAPVRVQLDSKGNILSLDRKGNRIVRVDAKGAYLGTVQVKTDGPDVSPSSFRVDAEDNVWVLDSAGWRVVVVNPAGQVTRTITLPKGSAIFTDVAVDPGGIAYVVDARSATVFRAEKGAAAFAPLSKSLKEEMSFPAYLAAVKGRIFVVDQVGNGIVILGKDGAFVGRQLSQGAAEGLVNYPSQICTTEAGDVFVANRGDNRLDQFSTAR